MTHLTVQQYQDVISNNLSPSQVEVLQILYSLPNSSATARQLTMALDYYSFPSAIKQIDTGEFKKYNPGKLIGEIGKSIAFSKGITPPSNGKGDRTSRAFSRFVGEDNKKTGLVMWDNLKKALENLRLVTIDNTDFDASERLPTETFQFDETELFKEGKVIQVFTNRYERNQRARLECIKHFGNKCSVCDFNFGEVYGDIAKGFIHVHHKLGLAEINAEYVVDPIKDLIPVCANCHSVIHLTRPAQTIDELKKRMKKSSR